MLPSVTIGLVGGVLEAITWILKTSEMDLLRAEKLLSELGRWGDGEGGDALEVGTVQP